MASLTGMYHLTEDFVGRSQGYPYFRWKIRVTPDAESLLTREELLAGIIGELTDATLSGAPEIWLSMQRRSIKSISRHRHRLLSTTLPSALSKRTTRDDDEKESRSVLYQSVFSVNS